MKRSLVRLLIWMSLLLTAGQASVFAQSEASYETALNDFRKSRIRESARALKAILLRDPRNKEAAMLLGTIYYQNHKLKKAYYLFEKGDPSFLTPDNAFAWGSTYLEFDEDKKAALGFRYIIKNKAPFRPFATYYLGVIAYKAAQWQKARKYFQRVNPEDLTVALRVNRRRYLADIKKQQDKLLESIIGGMNKSSQDLTGPEIPVATPMPPKDSGSEEELTAPLANALQVEREDQRGWRHSIRPSIMLAQQNQLADNHGLNHDNVALFAHREGFSGLANYEGGRRSGGLVGGLSYSLGDIGYNAQLEEVRYFKLEETSGVFTSQARSTQNESSGFVHLEPSLGVYVSEDLRLDLNLGVRAYFPEYDALQAWGQSSQQVAVRYEDAATELGLELEAQQPFDAKQKKDAIDFVGRLDAERQLGEIVRVTLSAYGWQTDHAKFLSGNRFRLVLADSKLRYRNGFTSELGASAGLILNVFSETTLQLRVEGLEREALNGVRLNRLRSLDSVESVAYGAGKSLVSLNIPLGDSASLTASAAYHLLTDYHYTELDANAVAIQEYVTDVEQTIYQAGGVISFADWIRLSGSYTVTTNNFLSASANEREFRRRNPDYTVDADFYLELAKSF
jgi:hypothetical protein